MVDPHAWHAVPFHFWSITFFAFGCIVGSFLNVVIHRLPIGESIVSPPSHCPHCRYSIPWYLNIPLVTWLYLRGKCRNCGAPISIRYFIVELLTGLAFLGCWLVYGGESAVLALVYCAVVAEFIAGTFIDFEHLIIPDQITLGGTVVGFVLSLLVPALHGENTVLLGAWRSLLGIGIGAGVFYLILRGFKVFLGHRRIKWPAAVKVVFTESSLHLPDEEVPYEEMFYRSSDAIELHANTVELPDRCYRDVPLRVALLSKALWIGEEKLDAEKVNHLEVTTTQVALPREVMGLGDVKFMAAIGAFLGWEATIFSLMASCVIGAAVGITLIVLGRRQWASKLPYIPYIAMAAAIWIYGGAPLHEWWAMYLEFARAAFLGRPR